MDIILIIIALTFIFSLRPNRAGLTPDYLNRTTTATINGLFIVLVVFSHFMTYVPQTDHLMTLTRIWMACKGQLIVATFLFFSGFGIMIQLKKHGPSYIDTFPVKRILFVWLKFAIAVSLFLILAIVEKTNLSPARILWSYFGLATLGNSGWYIFAILLMYLLTYLAFKLFAQHFQLALTTVLITSIIYIFIANHFQLPDYYYDTILCYSAGMMFANHHDQIAPRIAQSWASYTPTFIINLLLFGGSYVLCALSTGIVHYVCYQIAAITFVFIFVLIAMKFTLSNPFLAYAGGSAMFAIYILQRIPMKLIGQTSLASSTVFYFLAVITSTFLFGWIFDKLVDRLLRKVMHKS